DGDFDYHIHRDALTLRGREPPLLDRLHRLLIQATAETLQGLDIADGAVAANDDLEHDFAPQTAAACFFGVISANFLEEARRINTASRPIRPTTGAASKTVSHTSSLAGAESRSGPAARAATSARAMTFLFRLRFLEHTDARPVVSRGGHDRRDDNRKLLGFERRLGLWLRRFLDRLDRLRLAPFRERAAESVMSFPHRLGRRRLLQQSAAATSAAGSRRGDEDQPHRVGTRIV